MSEQLRGDHVIYKHDYFNLVCHALTEELQSFITLLSVFFYFLLTGSEIR